MAQETSTTSLGPFLHSVCLRLIVPLTSRFVWSLTFVSFADERGGVQGGGGSRTSIVAYKKWGGVKPMGRIKGGLTFVVLTALVAYETWGVGVSRDGARVR